MGELLIILLIVGILTIASMASARSYEKQSIQLLYSKTYYALLTAVYNIKDELKNRYLDTSGATDTIDQLPDKEFCQELATWLNSSTAEPNTCDNEVNYADYSGKSDQFSEDKIKLYLSNGSRIYMSKMFTDKEKDEDNEVLTRHRVVWVDVNGERGPNSADCSNNYKCDIFAFDIVNENEVIPLGYPKLEKGFLKISLSLPYDPDNPTPPKKIIDSYYRVQCMAFGADTNGVPKIYPFDPYSYTPEHSNENFANSLLKIPVSGGRVIIDNEENREIKEKDSRFARTLSLSQYQTGAHSDCLNNSDTLFARCSLFLEY